MIAGLVLQFRTSKMTNSIAAELAIVTGNAAYFGGAIDGPAPDQFSDRVSARTVRQVFSPQKVV